jgi:hypothetical protein
MNTQFEAEVRSATNYWMRLSDKQIILQALSDLKSNLEGETATNVEERLEQIMGDIAVQPVCYGRRLMGRNYDFFCPTCWPIAVDKSEEVTMTELNGDTVHCFICDKEIR